jgi:hypothetical protein
MLILHILEALCPEVSLRNARLRPPDAVCICASKQIGLSRVVVYVFVPRSRCLVVGEQSGLQRSLE